MGTSARRERGKWESEAANLLSPSTVLCKLICIMRERSGYEGDLAVGEGEGGTNPVPLLFIGKK